MIAERLMEDTMVGVMALLTLCLLGMIVSAFMYYKPSLRDYVVMAVSAVFLVLLSIGVGEVVNFLVL